MSGPMLITNGASVSLCVNTIKTEVLLPIDGPLDTLELG